MKRPRKLRNPDGGTVWVDADKVPLVSTGPAIGLAAVCIEGLFGPQGNMLVVRGSPDEVMETLLKADDDTPASAKLVT